MNRIKRITRHIFLLLAVATIAACNKGDDINEIFIGHQWQLTYIDDGGNRRWPGYDKKYSLQFTQSGFTANTPGGGSIKGSWQADGKTREFRCTNIHTEGISANDTIARLMIQMFSEATSYDGDTHYLQIIKGKNNLMQFYNR